MEAILEGLRAERARLRDEFEAGRLGGIGLVRALAQSMDRAVASLWDVVGTGEPGLALVALGGFARLELSPHSDVDLMVLHGRSSRASDVSERLFYALWDFGLTVGHATRTPKECVKLARANLEAETSFLEPRLVAGDADLFEEFADATLRQTRKRRARFISDVRAMMRARHLAGGSATSQLEPDLKEGAGGLRDLHVLGWFARVVGDPPQPTGDELEAAGLIGPEDADRIASAAEILHRVRSGLHYATDRPGDVLLFQHQRPLAQALGYTDDGRPAEDELMRALFASTRTVEHVVSSVAAELAARESKTVRRGPTGGGFAVEGDRVVLVREPSLADEPERAVELFAQGAPPGAQALRWLERSLAGIAELPWNDRVRRALAELLRRGDAAAVEAADHAGVIAKLIPEWDDVRCQPQHNVYHAFTVDAHLFNTVAEAAAFAHETRDPLVRDVFADLRDPDALMLSALLHDVGKGTEEDHALRGERLARAILDRMGIEASRRDRIVWLVRHHLLLVEAATRRDLNDESLIVDVATRVGDAERSRMLFLLTVADSRATGPTAWTPWKAALVSELFTKITRIIERGELVSRDALETVALRANELRDALIRYPSDAVEVHLRSAPRAYLLAFPTTTLIRHFALLAEPLDSTDARAHVAETGEPGVYEYTLVARDRPGLFGKVSGVLALNGVNIISAQGFTRSDAAAVEVFRCVGAFDATIDAARWDRITEDVRRALGGKLSLALRLAEKRAAYRRAAKGKPSDPKVIVDNGASDFLTVVEVHGPDRVGLLYDLTSTVADLALDIQIAKVATYGDEVVDVFYVRDLEGQKVTDPERLGELERALLLRLHGD